MDDPRFAVGAGIVERLVALERRIAELESARGNGILGTDQTIKASHDRLDSLLGAGNASSSNGPSQALVLDGSGLVPLADIPGTLTGKDADTLDTQHSNAFHGLAASLASSSTAYTFTLQSYVDLTAPQVSVDVLSGDIVVAIFTSARLNTAVRATAIAVRISNGTTVSTARILGADVASSWDDFSLPMAWTAAGTATWTIHAEVYVYNAGDTATVRYGDLVVLRFRPGGN